MTICLLHVPVDLHCKNCLVHVKLRRVHNEYNCKGTLGIAVMRQYQSVHTHFHHFPFHEG